MEKITKATRTRKEGWKEERKERKMDGRNVRRKERWMEEWRDGRKFG